MIHIWDLRVLRAELTELGLDWDWPSLPTGVSNDDLRPLAVQVDLGSELTAVLSVEETAQRDINRFRAALAANPNDVAACNGLAWTLTTAPEKLRRRGRGTFIRREGRPTGAGQRAIHEYARCRVLPPRSLSRGGGLPGAKSLETSGCWPPVRPLLPRHEPLHAWRATAHPRATHLGQSLDRVAHQQAGSNAQTNLPNSVPSVRRRKR